MGDRVTTTDFKFALTYGQLLESLRRRASRVIIVEGARCAGKDHLISQLSTDLGHYVYEVLKPRKQFLKSLDGRVSNLPAGLDIQQSHLWSLDVFRQIPDLRVIVNRSMLSSLYFDGPNDDRMSMWMQMVKTMDAAVVLVDPHPKIHASRIAKAGRAAEATSIEAEANGIRNFARQVPGLMIFSERA